MCTKVGFYTTLHFTVLYPEQKISNPEPKISNPEQKIKNPEQKIKNAEPKIKTQSRKKLPRAENRKNRKKIE